MVKERKRRSILKAITWRVCASLTTVGLVYLFTESFELAFSVGVLEAIIKMTIYYFHERIWHKVKWGMKDK